MLFCHTCVKPEGGEGDGVDHQTPSCPGEHSKPSLPLLSRSFTYVPRGEEGRGGGWERVRMGEAGREGDLRGERGGKVGEWVAGREERRNVEGCIDRCIKRW